MNIEVKYEDGKVEQFSIAKRSIVIGRSPQSDLQIVYEGISRRHAIIEEEFDGYRIQDLESANGVFLNETRIEPNKKIKFNTKDKLRLGTTIFSIQEKKETTLPALNITLDIKQESDRSRKASSYRANANKRPAKIQKQDEPEEVSSAYKNLLTICIIGAAVLYILLNYVWK